MVYKFMKKLISWNVNGIRACAGKGFMDFFNSIAGNKITGRTDRP